jgi:hypothetical protein
MRFNDFIEPTHARQVLVVARVVVGPSIQVERDERQVNTHRVRDVAPVRKSVT